MKKRLSLVIVLAALIGVFVAPAANAATPSYDEAKSLCSRWSGKWSILSRECSALHDSSSPSTATPTVKANCSAYGGTGTSTEVNETCVWSTLRPATAGSASAICSAMNGTYASSTAICSASVKVQGSNQINTYCSKFGGSYSYGSEMYTCTWPTLATTTVSGQVGSAGNLTYDEAKNLCARWSGNWSLAERKCSQDQNARPTPKINVNCSAYGGTNGSSSYIQECTWSTLRPATTESANAICSSMGGRYSSTSAECYASHDGGQGTGPTVKSRCTSYGGVVAYSEHDEKCTWPALATSYMDRPSTGGGTGGGSGGGSGGGQSGGGSGGGQTGGGTGGQTGGGSGGGQSGGGSIADVNEGDCTSILPGSWCNSEDGISNIVTLVVTILTGAVIVAGTIGIIFCGFIWMTARENEAQVAKAKKRMLEIVIGLVAWVLLALIANLFIPKSPEAIKTDAPGLSKINNEELKA